MTELQFLIDLLLNHKLSKATKDLISKRIGEVESHYTQPRTFPQPPPIIRPAPITGPVQSPSMVAKVAEFEAEKAAGTIDILPGWEKTSTLGGIDTIQPVAIVEKIAQTPLAQAAMQSRQQAIAIATSGKPEHGRTSPRKF